MKKVLLYFTMVVTSASSLLHAGATPTNAIFEQLAGGNLSDEYLAPFQRAADDLGIDLSMVHLRTPKEEICQVNPTFKQIVSLPYSHYVYINTAWFASLSPEAQRFAAGISCLGTLQPIMALKTRGIFLVAELALMATVGVATFKLLDGKNMSGLKKGLLAALAAFAIEFPIEFFIGKKVIASQIDKERKDRLNTIIAKLSGKSGALEYYQKYIADLEPYALHNRSVQVTIDALKADLRVVESL